MANWALTTAQPKASWQQQPTHESDTESGIQSFFLAVIPLLALVSLARVRTLGQSYKHLEFWYPVTHCQDHFVRLSDVCYPIPGMLFILEHTGLSPLLKTTSRPTASCNYDLEISVLQFSQASPPPRPGKRQMSFPPASQRSQVLQSGSTHS